MAEYDTLTIKIEADSEQAKVSVKELSSSLKRLNNTAKDLDDKRVAEVKGLLQDIANIDFSNVTRGLESIVSAFKAIQKTSSSSKAGSAKQLKTGYPMGGASLAEQQDLSSLSFNASQVELYQKRLEETILATRDLQLASINAKIDVDKLFDTTKEDTFADKLQQIGLNGKQIEAVFKSINFETDKFTGEQLEAVRNLLVSVGHSAQEADEIIGRLKVEVEETLSPMEQMKEALSSNGFNDEQISRVLREIKKENSGFTTEELDKLWVVLTKMGLSAEEADKAIKNLSKDTKKLGDNSKKSSNGLTKIANQFKNIMKYRVIRKIIQEIYKALVEGLQAITAFDAGANASMSRLTSAFKYLKDSIGAMFAPLIQMVEPFLTRLTMAVGDVSNKFAEFFASVNGQSTFSKAKFELKDYQDQLKKTQAIGIDELNVLSDDSKAGNFTTEQVDLGEKENELATTLKETFGKIKEVVEKVVSIAKDFIERALPVIITILKPLLNIISIIADLVIQLLDETSQSVNSSVLEFGKALASILSFIASALTKLSPLLKTIVNFISSGLNLINDTLEQTSVVIEFLFTLLEPFTPLLQLIGSVLSVILEVINFIIGGILKLINSVIGTALQFIMTVLKTVVALFKGDTDLIGQMWADLGKSLKKIWVDFANFFIRIINVLLGAVESFANFFVDIGATVAEWFGADTSGWGAKLPRIAELSYASGGFPEDGMFFANHNELVGQFSNGQTAVANNQQITQGIYEAVRDALREGGNGQEVVINLDGYELARVVTKKQKNFGADVVLGGTLSFGK